MIVCSTSHELYAETKELFGQSPRILHDLRRVSFKFREQSFAKRHRFCRDNMLQWSPLNSCKYF